MNKISLIASVLLCFLVSSCASIVSGSKQMVTINSTPSCADVTVDSQYVGQTPLKVNLRRGSDHVICIELDGYEPYEVICTREINGWVIGNIFLGGPLGLVIDMVTGSVYRLSPEQVGTVLREQRAVCCKKHQQSTIAVVMKPDTSWKKVGQLKRKY